MEDPRLIWPDTLSVATNGYLYVTANQLNRQAQFHDGHDLRQKPYFLFRTKIDAGPVLLRRPTERGGRNRARLPSSPASLSALRAE